MRSPSRRAEWTLLALITLGAAALRTIAVSDVSPDPFYDAAVRSMSSSLHNFFFGAFEPSGSVAIDKPPVDLWLQVASVKLLGFSSTTLKVPEILAGIASAPALHMAVRRLWSVWAGLASATAIAVLPIEVITARSDTMDAVMMLLLVIALWFIAIAIEKGSTRWLLAAAAVLGVSFDVKLLESVIALPGLFLIALLGMPGGWARRTGRTALAGVVYVVVALSWLTATLAFPASERPWAIGSTNGSAWNAAFVFNGTDRLGSKSPEPSSSNYEPGHRYPVATQSERDHIPILPGSPTRLLARVGPLSGERLGLELVAAVLLGFPALLWGLKSGNEPAEGELAGGAPPGAPAPDGAPAQDAIERTRRRRALAAGLSLWLVMGIVLFSHMERLHPRYVEGFTPAVAAVLGIGMAWACSPRGRARLAALALMLAASVVYSERLLYGTPLEWWICLLGGLGAFALACIVRIEGLPARVRSLIAPGAVMALSFVCLLAIPLAADVTAIEDHVTDAGYVGALPTEEQTKVSAYVLPRLDGAKYELAAESATQIGSLIVKDDRPILILTTYGGRVFTTVPQLQQLIAEGQVRFALLNSFCNPHEPGGNPACSAPAKWIRAHGRDVSRLAGLKEHKVLWELGRAE